MGGSTLHNQIRAYIFENFIFEDDSEDLLNNDDSFLEKGIIDSTGILEVVMWMEDTFGVETEDTELIPENLDSVNNIANFIERKKA